MEKGSAELAVLAFLAACIMAFITHFGAYSIGFGVGVEDFLESME